MAEEATGPEEGEAGEEQETESSQEEQQEEQQGDDLPKDVEVPWRGEITDEKAKKFAEQFTTLNDMAIGALKLRQKLSNAIAIPGEDATDEERAAYNEKIGVPASHEDYEIVVPEGTELTETEQATLANYAERMHAVGAPQAVVQAGFDIYMDMIEAGQKAHINKLNEKAAVSDKELTQEWGEDAAKNTNLSKAAAQKWGEEAGVGDEFVNFLRTSEVDGYVLGDHPMMRRVFAVIGRRMTEDNIHMGPVGEDRDTIQEQIDKIFAEHSGKQSYTSDAVQKKLQALYQQLEGDAPIVGTSGRAL